MTTKELSKKQIIVLMNNKNKTQFIKEFSTHITNINRVLKNIKSEIIADFVWLENTGIIITTNKVVAPLNLQMIKQYIKNVSNIETNHVDAPRLS